MSSKWRPEKYIDEYQKAIHTWVEESIQHLPHTKMKQKKHAPKNIINFVDLLKKSLNAKKYAKNDNKFRTKPNKKRSVNRSK
ncbi:MAG: hypothetical protein JO149_03670, partial [Gammaproteobacteria bacterium]|nr:hypothetical protein [Gammaproteobacteria bacterium]